MKGFFWRKFDSQTFFFLYQLQTTATGHRGAAGCCEGLQGASGAAEGYRGLREAVGRREGTPWSLESQILQIFVFEVNRF